jgi:hypothetical protein
VAVPPGTWKIDGRKEIGRRRMMALRWVAIHAIDYLLALRIVPRMW